MTHSPIHWILSLNWLSQKRGQVQTYSKSKDKSHSRVTIRTLLSGCYKVSGTSALFLLLLSCTVASSSAQDSAEAFDKLKSFAGEWVGTEASGAPVRVSSSVQSEGSALIETLHIAETAQMVTVYYRNGSDLMLTHFCSVGNQPRMRARPVSGEVKEITFDFIDATNLQNLSLPHNHGFSTKGKRLETAIRAVKTLFG